MTQQAPEKTISRRAYEIYEERGKTHGNSLDDWLAAEHEVSNSTTGSTKATKKAASTKKEAPPDVDIKESNSVRQSKPRKNAPTQKKGQAVTKPKKKAAREALT